MAAVKHLYTGYGDPNDNPDLALTGDAVGNHLYQDLDDDESVWMSFQWEGQHVEWRELAFKHDFIIGSVSSPPSYAGQFALSDTGELFIAMANENANWALQWRSIGQTGDWYQEP